MQACPALDAASVKSGDDSFRMRGGQVYTCTFGRGPSEVSRASAATAGSQCFGG